MNNTEIEFKGVALNVIYEYYCSEKDTHETFGSAAEVIIYKIEVDGVNIYELISANDEEDIKDYLICYREEDW